MSSPSPQLSFVTASCASSTSCASSASCASGTSSSHLRRSYPKSAYPPIPPIPPIVPDSHPHPHLEDPGDIRQLLWPAERLPYYSSKSGAFLGTINARMRSRPTTLTARATQRRYAHAILESMPVDGRDPMWREGVAGAACAAAGGDTGLWDSPDEPFPEEGVAAQLRQYGEVRSFSSNIWVV